MGTKTDRAGAPKTDSKHRDCNKERMSNEKSDNDLQPRERCPKCGGSILVESTDPLEEYCLNHPCDYYRAEGSEGGVIRE